MHEFFPPRTPFDTFAFKTIFTVFVPLERALNTASGIATSPTISQSNNTGADEIKHQIENFRINLFNDLNLAGGGETNWWALLVLFSIQFAPGAGEAKSHWAQNHNLGCSNSVVSESYFDWEEAKFGGNGRRRKIFSWEVFRSCTSCKLSLVPFFFLHCKNYWTHSNARQHLLRQSIVDATVCR